MRKLRCEIGLLDFGTPLEGLSAAATSRNTLEHICTAEDLGYSRYWLAEHHAPGSAWANPIPMLAALASATRHIRVGTGGSLLHLYSPLVLVNDISLLASYFPGRIDLGLARGLPTANIHALLDVVARMEVTGEPQQALTFSRFSRRVHDIAKLVAGDALESSQENPVQCVPPITSPHPELWVLGNSAPTGTLAAEARTGFAFSLMHSEHPALAGLDAYRRSCGVGSSGTTPRVGVAVAGECRKHPSSETPGSRRRQKSFHLWPTIDGDAASCLDQMQELDERVSPDLITFLDLAPTWRARRDSVTALARILELA